MSEGRTYYIGQVIEPGQFPLIDDVYRIDTPAPTRWFVAQTNPNCETRAEEKLGEAKADVYLPRLVQWQKIPDRMRQPRGPARRAVTRPLFPGYLFMGWSYAGTPPWFAIRRADGVRAVLASDVDDSGRGFFQRMATAILMLRSAEMAGDLDATVQERLAKALRRGRKRGARPSFAECIPQFIAMNDVERISALVRLVEGAKSC